MANTRFTILLFYFHPLMKITFTLSDHMPILTNIIWMKANIMMTKYETKWQIWFGNDRHWE